MRVPFSDLPSDAKIWIYPSSRKFYTTEIEPLEQKLTAFIDNWKKDAVDFKAAYKLVYNRFIIFGAQTTTTALSTADIDTSIAFIIDLQNTYSINLLDKMNVCFKQGEFVQYKDLKDFKKLLKNKAVTGKSIVFDNLINTKEELEQYWEVPIEDSWYGRFLK